ncbi:MAG: pyridoxal phosphate-dependent aminotransferase [Elusimicrobiota bacterium]
MTIDIRPRRSLLNPALTRPNALSSVPRSADTLWLDKNENLDPALLALSREVLSQMPPSAVATYPEAGEVYRKLARWAGVSPESLLLTPGSDGAIRLVFEAFVEHGEDVVHTSPTFAMYPVYCQMFGAKAHAVEYARKGDGPYLDPQAIVDAVVRIKPKLLCLPNPDSPTGTVLSPEDLRRILTACESVGSVFLLDEAYHPFHEWTAISWTAASRHLIVARTFAKAWGAAGLRIGYAAAHPETIALLHKMRPMYEVSTFAVEFMSRMLDRPADMLATVARIKEGKAFFVEKMRALGFTVLPTEGNFLHVAFGSRGPAIHAALAGKVLYRASFEQPCLAGYSRFSVAPKPIMARVADLIQEAVKK